MKTRKRTSETKVRSPARHPERQPTASGRSRGFRTGQPSGTALLREAFAAARASPVASALAILMIAGMCAAVLLTSGRTVGAEQAVIGSFDSAGTRSIVVRSAPDAHLDTSILERIRHIEGIEWAGAFGPATDVQNAAFPGGERVPMRLAWSDNWGALDLPEQLVGDGDIAFASPLALEQLGFSDRLGAVRTGDGAGYAVGGAVSVPDQLRVLEPLLIAPQSAESPAPVAVLIVVAETPAMVKMVADTVGTLLAVSDPSKVKLETSESLAGLRSLVEGQLGEFGRSLTLAILSLTAVLTAAILYGIVMMRRKEFGRRRALGASQQFIVALLMIQTALLASLGAVLGTAVSLFTLAATGDPLPGVNYSVGVAVLAITVGVFASLLPAIAAARREPITELRVP